MIETPIGAISVDRTPQWGPFAIAVSSQLESTKRAARTLSHVIIRYEGCGYWGLARFGKEPIVKVAKDNMIWKVETQISGLC